MLLFSAPLISVMYYVTFTLQPKETAIEFAQRVKADICKNGGLVDLPWYVVKCWWWCCLFLIECKIIVLLHPFPGCVHAIEIATSLVDPILA